VIATGVNLVTSTNDPVAHDEILAIRDACKILDDFQLTGCTLYASCEPCPMCLGAIYWARLDRVFYAATRDEAGRAGFDDALIYEEINTSPPMRAIPMRSLMHDEAQPVFDAWLRQEDRIEY
ncbi:MAG: nucleoside deaminase, partial [Pseudomonadota bacterium]